MKQLTLVALRSVFFLGLITFVNLITQAQDSTPADNQQSTTTTTTTTKTTDINITTDAGDSWYTQPWVWIVGAAVFILLLVALLNGSRGRDSVSTTDRVTIKKTVEKDSSVD